MLRKLTKFVPVILAAFLIVFPAAASAAPQAQQANACTNYTIDEGDTLSRLSGRVYDDVDAYPTIVEATNEVATEANQYSRIENPDVVDVGQVVCVPSESEAMNQTPTAPEGQMLLIVSNRTFENVPSTLTLSGGEFAGGEQFTIDAGETRQIMIEPGEYRATWSSPASELSFDQRFTAIAGDVSRGWIVPEDEQVLGQFYGDPQGRFSSDQPTIGLIGPESTTREEPTFTAPEGRALLVAGNRSLDNAPSTLTLTGGQFGGGQQFVVNHGQQLSLPLESGDYTFTWSSPESEDSINGSTTVSAGEVTTSWIVPEDAQVFMQNQGEAPAQVK